MYTIIGDTPGRSLRFHRPSRIAALETGFELQASGVRDVRVIDSRGLSHAPADLYRLVLGPDATVAENADACAADRAPSSLSADQPTGSTANRVIADPTVPPSRRLALVGRAAPSIRDKFRGHPANHASSEESMSSRSGTPIVLVADDDPVSRRLISSSLRQEGFLVVAYGSGVAALEDLAIGDPVDALVTDAGMTAHEGTNLAVEARALRPRLPVVFISARPANAADVVSGAHFLRRPYDIEQLRSAVDEAIASAAAVQSRDRLDLWDCPVSVDG